MRVLNFLKSKKENVLEFLGAAQMPVLFKSNASGVYLLQTAEVQRTTPIPYEFMR